MSLPTPNPMLRKDIVKLGVFLEKHQSSGMLSLTALHGFLVGLVTSSVWTSPDHWMPYVEGDYVPSSEDEEDELHDSLMRFYHHCILQLEGVVTLKPYLYRQQKLVSLKTAPEYLVKEWCYQYYHTVMYEETGFETGEDLTVDLFPFAVLSGELNLIGERGPHGQLITDDRSLKAEFRSILVKLLEERYQHWVSQYSLTADEDEIDGTVSHSGVEYH